MAFFSVNIKHSIINAVGRNELYWEPVSHCEILPDNVFAQKSFLSKNIIPKET